MKGNSLIQAWQAWHRRTMKRNTKKTPPKQKTPKTRNSLKNGNKYIPLNINRLNVPIKDIRLLNGWKKGNTYLYAAYERLTSDLQTHTDVKGQKKIVHTNAKKKKTKTKADVAIFKQTRANRVMAVRDSPDVLSTGWGMDCWITKFYLWNW